MLSAYLLAVSSHKHGRLNTSGYGIHNNVGGRKERREEEASLYSDAVKPPMQTQAYKKCSD